MSSLIRDSQQRRHDAPIMVGLHDLVEVALYQRFMSEGIKLLGSRQMVGRDEPLVDLP